MTRRDDFSSERDPTLGAILREQLGARDDVTFVAAVMDRVLRERRESSWDILAGWAPLGVAAAAVVALGAGLWLGMEWRKSPDLLAGSQDPVAQWLSSADPVTNDFVLTAVLSGDGIELEGERR